MPTYIIGSRKSDLARLQAYCVGKALKAKFKDLEIEYYFKESLGDKNLTDPLWKMPEKGVFTEDFEQDLKNGKVDMVVHSWKDLPTEERKESSIVATQEREDMRDLLVFKQESLGNPKVKIMTSSPRRAYNLNPLLKTLLPHEIEHLEFTDVRGNIPTRLKKMVDSDADGIIVAKAAIDRLLAAHEEEFLDVQGTIKSVLSQCYWMVLPLSLNPTAAAQGALAIEVHDSKLEELKPYLDEIHCEKTFADVRWEREYLKSFGGGCHQKLGMNQLRRSYGTVRFARGLPDNQDAFSTQEIVIDEKMPMPVSRENIWPQSKKDYQGLFYRTDVATALPKAFEAGVAQIWIAKHSALPKHWVLPEKTIIWTAGLATWKKLADRGVWVNGSAESLGENEDERLRSLLGIQPNWIKLTHQGAVSKSSDIGTYKLQFDPFEVNFDGVTHIFWTSKSMFEALSPRLPKNQDIIHACGPGHTMEHLKSLGLRPYPFLSYRQWLDYVNKGV